MEIITQNGITYRAVEIKNRIRPENESYKEQLQEIKEVVSVHTGVADITQAVRLREVVRARQLCHFFAFLIYNNGNTDNFISISKIGLEMGYKDHATVLHSNKTVKNSLVYKDELEQVGILAIALNCTGKLMNLINNESKFN